MVNNGGMWVRGAQLALAAAIALVVGACSGESAGTDAGTASDEFGQTWSKAYSDTTCAEYKSQMTTDQQRVMAADMLVGARSVDKVTTMPSDEMIGTFRDGLTTACVLDTAKMSEMGAALYLTEKDRWQG